MADEKTPARAQVHLPTAPDGWDYKIVLDGPGSEDVQIEPEGDGYKVTLTTVENGEQSTKEADLKSALKAAVDAAKAINRLETRKKALEAEQAAAASIFGSKPASNPPQAAQPKTAAPSSPAAGDDDAAADQPTLA